ncbi:hypothetical protein [Streptomyces sp. NPDC020780]|uniref:hypothetical protein n=1 Tax=unclassified Streptomyces TaxID=2593676 RepID=UPI0037953AA4
MRSARTLFASAAVTAVLAVSVPASYAVTAADGWDKDSGSSSSSDDGREKPDSWKHDKPEGGMHTGGGALAGVSADDWQKDKEMDKGEEKEKEKGSEAGSDEGREKSETWKHDKPEGGMHAGGGALAGVSADDWQKDKEEGSEAGSDGREKSETWKHEKPQGGMHTGGGAMALSGSSLAAGSVLMLGGIGAAAYRLRRRNASGAAAV